MTLDTNFVLDSLDSLWHYGLRPTSLPLHTSTSSPNFTHTPSCCSVSSDLIANAQPIASRVTGSLQSLFAVMDEDGDGRLSLHEMCSLLAQFGISSHSNDLASALIKASIPNPNLPEDTSSTHDMSLDFPQFIQLYASLFGASSQDCPSCHEHPAYELDADDCFDDEILHIFEVYDTNHDGFISAAELAAVLLDLGMLPDHCATDAHLGTCQAYIDSADLDGNGLVDLKEFKSMMMYSHPPKCIWV